MKQVKTYVVSNELILPGGSHQAGRALAIHLMRLHCPVIASESKPGQFVMVRCGHDCVLPRPFSIHQVNDGGITLFYAVWEDGKGTTWLSQRKVGDIIELFGPLGNGYSIHLASHNLLLVAGGTGIAPLLFLAQEALKQNCSVTLLYGTATKERYEKSRPLPSGIRLISATEDGTIGKKGKVTDLLPESAEWADQIFACGPIPMYRDIALKQQELKLEGKEVQISLEVRMGCGFGICYGCTLKTKNGPKQVCQNGPVFDLEDILWDELNY